MDIYIFTHTSKGAEYGVGTYINQLRNLKINNCRLHIVHLNSDQVTELSVIYRDGVKIFIFPNPILVPFSNINLENYHTNVIRLLSHFVDKNANNIYHLNFLDSFFLAKSIKKYLKGKIILTIHYSQSLFLLKGKVDILLKIINSKESYDELPEYFSIRKEVNTVKEMIGQFVDKVISVSKHSYLLNNEIYHLTKDKNVMVYNALNDSINLNFSSQSELKKELGITTLNKIIIFAGRLDEIKGLQCLLQSLTILKKKSFDFHLFIAGKGEFQATMDFVQDLYTNITFTGFVNKDRLYKLLSVADIGVVPSLYEEFGYVILEMMMHQLPVIAFKTTGPAEIIEDGYTGLLADLSFDQPDQSIQNLAEKIEFIRSFFLEEIQLQDG